MTPSIDVKNLSFSYRKKRVIENISFAVEQGDFFIIIGPNGSGKSTLMKLLANIEKKYQGSLYIHGTPIQKYTRSALAKKIAFVPQTIPEEFPFTVTQIVLMGRSPHLGLLGVEGEKDLEIAQSALRFTGIDHLAERKLNEISGGERQRAFIARALCQEPSIILLDEPTASLDLAHQIRIMDLMEKLKKEKGITCVMVSHDINLAAMYADSLLLLKNGRIKSIGPPSEVLTYQTLTKTYECELQLDQSPVNNAPRVTLIPGRAAAHF